MTAPAWLDWIKPAPVDAAELARIDERVAELVKRVSTFKDRPDWRAVVSESRAKAKKYRAAVKALASLPEPSVSAPPVLDLCHDLAVFAEACEATAEQIAKSGLAPQRKGRAIDWNRWNIAHACECILSNAGLDDSDAATARLALWVWNEANGLRHDGRASDLDAWESTVRRFRGR